MNKFIFIKCLNARMSKNGHTQVDVADICRITQSQVSKILKGKFSRQGKAVNKLIEYSKYNEYYERHPTSKKIEEAIADVWDGSPQMELKIAQTIREIGGIWQES